MKNLIIFAGLVVVAVAVIMFADANAEIVTTQIINGIQY